MNRIITDLRVFADDYRPRKLLHRDRELDQLTSREKIEPGLK